MGVVASIAWRGTRPVRGPDNPVRRLRPPTAAAAACRWVPSGSRCPSRGIPRSRSRASSGSPRPPGASGSSASCQSSHSQSRSRPASRWSQGSTSSTPRSRVVYQSRSTGSSASTAAQASAQRSYEKCSLHPSKRPPPRHTASMTRPDPAVTARQQTLDRARACRRGSGSRWRARTAGRERTDSRSRASRASVVSWSSCSAHWNGVCGLGTKPPIDTVHRMSRRPDTSRPVWITRLASVPICITSSSVSVGSPHMK